AASGRRRREREGGAAVVALEPALPAREEEELIALDGSADGAAELVGNVLGLVLARRPEIIARLQVMIIVEFEERTVELIGAALELHVDDRASGHPLLGVEAVGGDIHRLDGFQVRHHGALPHGPDVHVAGAIEISGYGGAAGAV